MHKRFINVTLESHCFIQKILHICFKMDVVLHIQTSLDGILHFQIGDFKIIDNALYILRCM